MQRHRPQSSNIREIAYDPASREMQVTFHSGSTYSYQGVSAADHQAFVGAPSAGSHFAAHIKGKYQGVSAAGAK